MKGKGVTDTFFGRICWLDGSSAEYDMFEFYTSLGCAV
jgi:hypothetical protein